MSDDRLERAIGFVQSGKLEEARDLLEQVLKEDRTSMPAWHWYAQTWPANKDQVRVWEACLRFNPDNQQAKERLRELRPREQVTQSNMPVRERKTGPDFFGIVLWGGGSLLAVLAVVGLVFYFNAVQQLPPNFHHTKPVDYYLYPPRNYTADQEWPLFIGIHGSGGSGLDCWRTWQSYADQEGFILLCPTIPGDPNGFRQDVGEDTVWRADREVQKDYRIRKRMFMAGFSAGAFFIQGFDYHYPQYVSGLAILSSGLYLKPSLFPELIPMAVVIGSADDSTAVNTCLLFVSEMQEYGFDVDFNIIDGVGHNLTSIAEDVTIKLFRQVKDR